jgi:hypothetical protein
LLEVLAKLALMEPSLSTIIATGLLVWVKPFWKVMRSPTYSNAVSQFSSELDKNQKAANFKMLKPKFISISI